MMSHLSSRAGELKSQGAIEAAQNSPSKLKSEDAEHVILNESQKAGAMAFQFDPNASPEAKAAQAHTVRLTVLFIYKATMWTNVPECSFRLSLQASIMTEIQRASV